ncbi:MAG TPA: carboxypeptidase-like regulatory domain-containing protein [Candidatus Acidoferrum sp.]|nr:carboxypeptidase-like regulatory domain-containing protein [Candidatus Acidoferrum sp.]
MNRISTFVILCAFLLGLGTVCSTVSAQTASTSVVLGTVSDQSGAVLAAATVTLTNLATGAVQTATSNDAGQYTFPIVTPGSYTIAVEKQGFRKSTVRSVVVDVGKSYLVNVSLELGEVKESLIVEAGASVELQTTTAKVGNVISEDEMTHLPTLQHSAAELIALQPAVSPGTGDNTFPTPEPRASGAMDDQNTYTLDGIDISDNLVGGGTWVPVNIDSVAEFDIGVTNPNATAGRSSGGQVNLLGRHGTNNYHGSVYWYTQNSAFNANSWDNNSAKIKQPHLDDNRGGVRFGGPIRKDKTFFFANYELRRFPQSDTITRVVPTATLKAGILQFQNSAGVVQQYNLASAADCGASGSAACDPRSLGISPAIQAFWKLMPAGNFAAVGDGLNYTGFRGTVSAPEDDDFGVFRLDHNFSDKWKFSGSYTYFRSIAVGSAPQVSIANGNLKAVSSSPTRAAMVTGQLVTQITPMTTNAFSFGWVRDWVNFPVETPTASATSLAIPGTNTSDGYIAINPAEGLLDAPIDNNTTNARFQDYFQKNIQFTDNLSWVKGKHTLQFGTDDRRLPLKNDRADKVVNGITSLVSVLDTAEGRGTFLSIPGANAPPLCTNSSTASSFCLQSADLSKWNQLYAGALGLIDNTSVLAVRDGSLKPLPFGTALSNNTVEETYYFYGQDVWRISNSLTLTYGLSYGWQNAPTDSLGRQTIEINAATGQFLTVPSYISQKQSGAQSGTIFNPQLGYLPVNTAHHPVFSTDWGDIAPRASVAWNPTFDSGLLGSVFGNKKTVIRGGYSRVFDRESTIETVVIPMLGVGFGQVLNVATPLCNASGSAGTGCNPTGGNPGAAEFRVGVDGNIPVPSVPTISSPIIPSTPFGEVLSFQDDPNMKVGRSNNFSLTIQRELPSNMLMEVGWIGHWASHLPTSADITNAPYMFVDKTSGQSFAQAFDAVAAALRANKPVPTQPFFENELPGYGATNCSGGTATACLVSGGASQFLNGLTQTLFQGMDLYRFSQGLQPFDNLQTVLSEIRTYEGHSNYNGLIVTLQKKTSNGLTFQANYTFSKSLDEGLINQNNAGYFSNSYNINASYGPSLYDRKHAFTGQYVYQLPAGDTHRLHLNHGLDRLISGWYTSGVFTAYTGLPLTVAESPEVWGVVGFLGSGVGAIPTVDPSSLNASVHSGVAGSNNIGTTGDPAKGGTGLNIFANPAQAFADFRAVNLSTDGRDGASNPLRGLGMWNFDAALGKSTTIRESWKLEFSAQFLNLFNHVNFQTPGLPASTTGLSLQGPSSFGVITNQFVPANRTAGSRWIELGLRLSF